MSTGARILAIVLIGCLVISLATAANALVSERNQAALTNEAHQVALDGVKTQVDSLEALVKLLTNDCRLIGSYEWAHSDSVTVITRCEVEKDGTS